MNKRIFVNTLINYLSFGVQLIFNILQLKILTNYLGKTELGTYFYAMGISLAATSVAIAGFQPVLTRFIPVYEAENKKVEIQKLFGLAILVYFSLSSIFAVVLEIAVPQVHATSSSRATMLFGLMLLLNFVLQGERKLKFFSLFPATVAAGFTFSLWFLRNSLYPGLIFLLFALWATLVIPFQMLAIGIQPQFRGIKGTVKSIWGFWKFAFGNSLLYPVILYADRVIIWKFADPASVAEFTVAKKFADAVRRTLHVLSHVAAPEMSYDHARKQGNTAKIYRYGFMGLGFLLTLFMIASGKYMLLIFSNSSYINAYRYLVILTVGVFVGGYWETWAITAYSRGQMNLSLLIWASWSLLYFSVASLLTYLWGTTGTAMGYLLVSLAVSSFLLLKSRHRKQHIN